MNNIAFYHTGAQYLAVEYTKAYDDKRSVNCSPTKTRQFLNNCFPSFNLCAIYFRFKYLSLLLDKLICKASVFEEMGKVL